METPLTQLGADEEGLIVSLQGGYGMQARLRSLGLVEGQRIRKLSHIGRSGPVIVLVNRMQVAVGFGMARRILIRPRFPRAR
jgi:ferrous iron transport protein A